MSETWNPWIDPISPSFDGIRIEMRNLDWQADLKDGQGGSINGEWRVVSDMDENGAVYLLVVREVSLPEFIQGHIGAQLGALMRDRPSGWNMFTLTNPDAMAFEFELEVSWTGTVICLPMDVLNDAGTRLLSQVALMDPLGQRVVPVTQEQERGIYYPCLSPDGTLVTFASDRDAPGDLWEIYVADIDGSNITRLTWGGDGVEYYWPSFSRDQTSIVFTRCAGYGHLYTVAADGSSTPTFIGDDDDWETTPCYAPDGEWLCCCGNVDGVNGLWARRIDLSERRLLREGTAHYPMWSPDGSRIAFISPWEDVPMICSCDIYGADLRSHTDWSDWEEIPEIYYPCWSPGSDRILFYAKLDGQWALHTVAIDGGAPEQITPWADGHGTKRTSWGPW